MAASRTTDKKSNMSVSGRVSNATDRELERGLEYIKRGDACRDNGDFDKAKTKYEKAAKFCPIEAREQLEILPLFKLSKTSVEDSAPDRYISVEIHAHSLHAKKKFKQMWSKPPSISSLQQTFFPRPPSSSQLTVPSLSISSSQSTSMSTSTCTTSSTSTSQFTMSTSLTLASQTVVSDFGTVSDVRSLAAAYKTADDGARTIIQQKIYDIIKEFGQHQVTFDTVQELVVLAEIQVRDIFLHIVTEILCVLKEKSLLSGIALQGLAVILDLFPDEIDMSSVQGAFVEILASLQHRLHGIRTVNNDLQLMPLLSALNALLDTMVRRKVFGLERQAIYNDLRTLLTGLTSHSTVMVCFQALYAKQALAIIGNDESLPMSVFRRGKLAFVLAGNVSNMATKFDVASAESAYQNIMEFFDFSVQDRWYQGLIYVDYLVGQCRWWQLEDFVLRSKFQSDICFLLGVVLRLEQIAAVQVDVEVRDGAINLLTFLEGSDVRLVPEMARNTLRRLERLKNSAGSLNDDAAAHQRDLRPVWDPAWLAAPKGILFKAVQDKDRYDATMNSLPARLDAFEQAIQSLHPEVAQSSLEDVHSALQTYYKRDLAILRVSGDKLDLETCFVNLAIVEAPAQREKDKQDLKEQAAVFHRIPSSEVVGHVNMQKPIPLEEIFDKRKLRDGKENIPKTILVQGRAGVGKTTLCKKLVHAHQTGLWRDRFDNVLWLPMRQIKAFKARTLEGLFREKFFTQGLDQDGAALAHELALAAQRGRILFILDGLDEIAKDTRGEDDLSLRQFLEFLLRQQHVVITSRPSGLDRSLLPPSIDLELETVGFNQQNVNDFVSKVLSPKAAETVQRFIRQTPLIRGLVNIPVQLDVICYSWDSLPTEGPTITMTGLYQLMVRKLWCKDAVLLRKTAGGKVLTQDQTNQLAPAHIERLMATELQHLGYLAFRGMENNHQIEFDAKALLGAFEDLDEYQISDKAGSLPPQLVEIMKQTSFLHTADTDLDASKNDFQQAWYFLHLTFQEYFAATWVARHLQQPIPTGMQGYFASTRSAHDQQQILPAGMMTTEQAKAFVLKHKYNPRYEIMWWMVAGLLEGKALEDFFDLLQGAPRDLIGGRHQQILASCLNEARARLNTTVVTRLDAELMEWVALEITTCRDKGDGSILGSQSSFPDVILVKMLGMRNSPKTALVKTLGARSTLSEAAIQTLIGALKDDNANVRSSAASALDKQSTLSEAAVHSLIGALKDTKADVRSSAAKVLGKQSTLPEAAIHSLIIALKDNYEHEVRSSAESALGNQSSLSEAAIQPLVSALNNENEDVRSMAAWVLGKQSTLPEMADQALIGALRDEAANVRSSAASALGRRSSLSEVTVQALTGALLDENANVRCSAASALDNCPALSEAILQTLVSALKDEAVNVRSSAASALGRRSTLSEVAVQALIAALRDEDANVRSSAASALGRRSTLSEAILQTLVSALKDEAVNVRFSAASALSRRFALSQVALQALIGALRDEAENVRSSAASALGRRSTLSEVTVQALIGALSDEAANVRSSAASALGEQSTLPEVAVQALIGALSDEAANVRSSAASTLGRRSTLSEVTVQALIGALRDGDADVRSSAESALGRQSTLPEVAIQALIGVLFVEYVRDGFYMVSALDKRLTLSEATTLLLIGELSHEKADVRYSAAWALGRWTTLPEVVIQSLSSALKDDSLNVRYTAAWALRRQSTLPEVVIQSLIAALQDEDALVRDQAAEALGKQSTLSEAAIQALSGALKDEDEYVRSSAASALRKQSTLSEAAVHSLIDALKDTKAHVRSSAAKLLGKQSTLSEVAIQSLIGALKHANNDGISVAALVLGKRSPLSETALHSIISALQDDDVDVSRGAASVLASYSTLSEAALQSLTGALNHDHGHVRQGAASTLGRQSTLSESAIQSLIGALKDKNANVRYSAASALGKQSTLSASIIKSLVGLLKDKDLYVRNEVERIFDNHYDVLCMALPSLYETEIISVCKNYLFRYSCRHVLSLQVQDNRLCYFTEQGLRRTETLGVHKVAFITSAVESAIPRQFRQGCHCQQPH